MSKLIKEILDALNAVNQNKTQPYDRQGEVKRIEGKTAWVKLEGSDRETPIQMTIACDVGDTVQARIGGGSAWLTGNLTAPPTDDKKANEAITMVTNVVQEVQEQVEEALEDATDVEDVTMQYCLSDSSSTFVQYGDWSDTPPEYVSGKYYWTRSVLVDDDGNETYGEPRYSQDTQLSVETDIAFKSNNNHFWHDSSGAYVTTADKSYANGSAVRITASGILQQVNGSTVSSWTNSGISFLQSGSTVASFGQTVTLGSWDDYHTEIGAQTFIINDGVDDVLNINASGESSSRQVTVTDMGERTSGVGLGASRATVKKLQYGITYTVTMNGVSRTLYASSASSLPATSGINSGQQRLSFIFNALSDGYSCRMTQRITGSTTSFKAVTRSYYANVIVPIMRFGGNIVASDNITASGLYAESIYANGYKLLTIDTVTDSFTVNAKNYSSDTVSASKTGYKAIGVVGWSKSGTSSTWCNMYNCYMDNNDQIHYGFRNLHESSDASLSLVFYVLYVASTQGV